MLEPAKTIIEICGGVEKVAKMVGRSTISVRRWGYEKAKGGSDGFVPTDSQNRLLLEARKEGLGLEPHHFFRDPDGEAPSSRGAA